jgi:glycosyltransferase involved in cell wall biosynthesis
MKILFISHVNLNLNPYGAATSSRIHLDLLKKYFYIDVWCQLLDRDLLTFFKKIKNKIKFNMTILPISNNYLGYKKSIIKDIMYYLRICLFYLLTPLYLIYLNKKKYQIIHLSSFTLIHFVSLSYILGDRTKFILHVREVPLKRKFFENIFLKKVDEFICIDEYSKSSLIKIYSVSSDRVKVLHNPVITDLNSKFLLRNSSKPSINIGMAGNFSDGGKGYQLIGAFLESPYPVSIHLVGRHSVELKENFSRKYNKLSISAYQEVDDLVSSGFYNSIDALLRLDDPFRVGRTFLEALAHSCPVIVSCNDFIYDHKFITKNVLTTDFNISDSINTVLKKLVSINNSQRVVDDVVNSDYLIEFKEKLYVG